MSIVAEAMAERRGESETKVRNERASESGEKSAHLEDVRALSIVRCRTSRSVRCEGGNGDQLDVRRREKEGKLS